MNLNNLKLLVSAVSKKQYPIGEKPEIALAGRSNVGKSSLINKMLKRRALARVSSSPGKTATINFYDIDGVFNLVDLPGYGFAKTSMAERERWGRMIEEYLNTRKQLVQVILLVDFRHKPTKDDAVMFNWIVENGYSPVVVATKYDKVKASKREESVEQIKKTLGIDDFYMFSSETGFGREELWNKFGEILGVDVGGI